MIEQGKTEIQRELHGNKPSMANARGALGTVIDWAAGLTWSWFGTWIVSAVLAIVGGIVGSKRFRRPFIERRGQPLALETVVTPSPEPA
jgi:hypothetical protein